MVISLPPEGAPGTGRQQEYMEGMPFGTRGGMVAEHDFPADGEYELTIGDMALAREVPRHGVREHGDRAARRRGVLPHQDRRRGDHKAIDQTLDPAVEGINNRLRKIHFHATAGQHKLAVTFLQRSFAESDERARTVALEGGQERIQAAHALQIRGPLRSRASARPRAARRSSSASRPRLPATLVRDRDRHEPRRARFPPAARRRGREAADGVLRARAVARRLRDRRARRADRRFSRARSSSIARSRAQAPAPLALSDLELASRLSFFLWGSVPDDELLEAGRAAAPHEPTRSPRGRRMLADDRAKSLVDDFAFQWLGAREARHARAGPRAVPAGERPARSARPLQGGARALHRQRAAQRSERDGRC